MELAVACPLLGAVVGDDCGPVVAVELAMAEPGVLVEGDVCGAVGSVGAAAEVAPDGAGSR